MDSLTGLPKPATRTCSVCGPTNNYYAKGFCGKHYSANRLKQNPDAKRRYDATNRAKNLLLFYKITPEDYERLRAAQGGRCAICKNEHPGGGNGNFAVDHCHLTGAVRGLLCIECNFAIGKFKDRADLCFEAGTYLKRSIDV